MSLSLLFAAALSTSLAAPAKAATPAAAKAPAAPSAPAPKAEPATPAARAEPAGEGVLAHLAVPLFDERFQSVPVARVEDEVIELRELLAMLQSSHESRVEGRAGKTDHTAALDRLIDVRLIVLEARDSGMDELPEVAEAFKSYRESALTSALRERATKGAKADPKVVEKLLQDAVREWKVTSILFPEEKDAHAAAAQVQGGKSFDEVVKQAVADKKAHGTAEPQFVHASKLVPGVAAALQTLKPGQTSAPLRVEGGFTLIRLDGERFPENPQARATAEAQALGLRKSELLKEYYQGMMKRWAKVDEALLKALDFEAAKPGLEALKKDKRVLARITGEKQPITVAQLTAGLEKEFFHGFAEAAKAHRINKQKATHLDAIVSKIIVQKEATRLGLDQMPEYKQKVADYENSILFGAYVDKAIVPAAKVEEKELQEYYQAHKADYTFPAFYKLETLGFYDLKAAQAAVDKLRAGTDFKWMKTNAEGQLKSSDLAFDLEGGTVSAKAMPPELAKVMGGVKKGDFRLYSQGVGHYVIHVLDEVPASEQPYEQARGSVAEKVLPDRIGKAIREAGQKLRQAYQVRTYITRIGG